VVALRKTLMQIIGLIGGVASGKSAVGAALARRGAVVFNADEFGHAVLKESEVRDALVKRWGPGVLGKDGEISRPAVARIVFARTPEGEQEREYLEQLVHPGIRRRIEAAIQALPETSIPAVVIDAALLLEAGWASVCTAIVFVDASREQRLARARTRGWSDDEFSRREAAQLPIEEKRRRASYVLENFGTLADLDAAVSRYWGTFSEKITE
jgi:dephospho-CoA kinase